MVFPQTPLPSKAELLIGGAWVDVTSRVRGEQTIRITRGRQDEGGTTEPTRCFFTLGNNDGRYSPNNPTGPYYGQIGRNTPCRVSVMTGDVYLDLTGSTADYAETVDTPALDIVGDIDVRIDMSLENWLPPPLSNDTVEMIGKFSSGQKSWFLGSRGGFLRFEWSADGTNSLSATSTAAPVIPGSGRLAVRATLDVNNGASGNTVTFYTADTLDSPWVQLGDPVVQSGTTSIFSSTAALRIGNATGFIFNQPLGRCHKAEVRSGIWGTVVANPIFSVQAVGTTSFSDAATRTWTINGGASITNRKTRFYGEVSGWAVRWETKQDVVTQVEASGIMRRLSQGASPVRSAIYREFTNPARTGIVAYWPMEDGATATAFASAFDGEQPMTVHPTGVTPANYSGWAASDAIPTFETGRARGRVPAYTSTNYSFTRFFTFVPSGGVASTQRLFSIATTGTARTWTVYLNTGGDLDLRAYNAAGTQILATGFDPVAINGKPVHIAVELTQDGADIDYSLLVFYIDESTLTLTTPGGVVGTLAANTFGGLATEVRIGQDGGMAGTAIGHIAVANDSNAFGNTLRAMVAHKSEEATERIYRLGEEEMIPAYAVIGGDQQMGVQRLATLLELVRECEAVDGGILCEGRAFLGFRYRDRASLLNQMPALTLDYPAGDGLVTPLNPDDDDQKVRNDRTVARTGGSSSRAELLEGTLSVQAPPDGVGRYDDSTSLNLHDDDQPFHIAGWLLHLGTWDATRYPVVKILLHAATHLIEDAAAVDVGDRMQITSPPAWLPPDTIDLHVQGYTETLSNFEWTLEYNCAPAGAWDVAWLGDDDTATARREFAWLDTAGSELAEALTDTETGVDVLATSGPLWTIAYPSITVNSSFETDLTGWSGFGGTATRVVTPEPAPFEDAWSLKFVPDGVAQFPGPSSSQVAVTVGRQYVVSGWLRCATARNVALNINWFGTAGAYLSTSANDQPVEAGIWHWFELTATAPANSVTANVAPTVPNFPPVTDELWIEGVTLRPAGGFPFDFPFRIRSGGEVMTVNAATSSVVDTFTRTTTPGWGTPDVGSAWVSTGGAAADHYTQGTEAAHQLTAVDVARLDLTPVSGADHDVQVDIATAALATGGPQLASVVARAADGDNLYMAQLSISTAQVITLTLRKRVAGAETQLATYTTTLTHAAFTFYRVRLQVIGPSLQATVRTASAVDQNIWRVTATDTALTTGSNVGCRSVRQTANTNANLVVSWDNVALLNPQTLTVERSTNGVVKTHSAEADGRLARPAIAAL